MPVRIYDISKKLGLENKEVLSKAKQLGLVAARVASSSLDKITAEYLEQQLILEHPNLVAPPAAPIPVPAAAPEPILLVSSPPPQAETVQSFEPATMTALVEPPAPPEETAHQETSQAAPVLTELTPPEPIAKAPPPPPPGPKVGDKVGFIQLPPKPGPRPAEKAAPVKLPAR